MSKDPLLLTKLAGAALVVAWIAVAAVFVSSILYRPGSIDSPAYPLLDTEIVDERPTAPAAPEAGTEAPVEPAAGGIGALLAAADAAAGEKVAKKCAACHSFEEGGRHKIGPNLWNVVGRGIGAVDGYKFSAALAEHGGTWGYDELDAFLTAPKTFAAGTKMTFAGLRNEADRADVIAYLRNLSDNPKPLP
ncbi:MAG: cytochrome c family protein [Alphaproteobacteria bacterium]|nr:cytochrome c family protein [Alphaproteobacteria bacterium]